MPELRESREGKRVGQSQRETHSLDEEDDEFDYKVFFLFDIIRQEQTEEAREHSSSIINNVP